MSWRWVVDTRGGTVKVDWKWLAFSLVAGLAMVVLLRALLPDWAVGIVIVVLIAVAITLDVLLRRRHPASGESSGETTR